MEREKEEIMKKKKKTCTDRLYEVLRFCKRKRSHPCEMWQGIAEGDVISLDGYEIVRRDTFRHGRGDEFSE